MYTAIVTRDWEDDILVGFCKVLWDDSFTALERKVDAFLEGPIHEHVHHYAFLPDICLLVDGVPVKTQEQKELEYHLIEKLRRIVEWKKKRKEK